ncbi:1,3-beta-galactosyl-N-acetylhexosamine phosphorylase [Halolactibacillus miurensis]|uniref:1,3-beta-galactosyl-N-acetylhexosamine phosphorylase n=1 Tax=Halolactibacillus miurensis TaxID=306541 RepID=A0A1I6P4H9_9BACI|nr:MULTISPECIES: 1,3-beta-galactosyl-N-acetylhexosamine phosphorylase [Halolactibacillus]GEM03123.1 1,3-beta-galactosyl-N-acetylhexosamine phosphorylase [Halolactibacillus miurensis]SFS35113.1 1,3-beta-galactosyl-N-acetylhexosamine phosphorylase [Halolactibacillus miurensis]
MTKGRVTLPAQEGMDEEIKKIVKRWGADAVRDSDGTKIPDVIKKEADKVYSKYFFTRGDQDFAKENLDELQHMFIMSEPVTATEEEITIPILAGYFKDQLKPDTDNDPKKWWQVIDRTTGEVVSTDQWEYLEETEEVKVTDAKLWHRYTVNVLVYQIWDPVHMYNHITNDWTTEHQMPYDPRYPKTRHYILERLRTWLDEHPDTDVVRITTFFYNFTLVFNDVREEKYVDWFGYGATVSPKALEAFEKEKGYKLTAEDFVDQGYYNSPFRMPKKAFLDWIDFQSKFVSELAKECVDIIHSYGKEAMMFLGDHWAGTEPYGKYFKNIGLDAVVGSVGDGTTLRMIADIPHVDYHEGRFLPYFFPDTFNEHNNPVIEANQNWLQSRRAILRKPIQRMGYGGYLSLALDFPDFVDRVEEITDEFRDMHDHVKEADPYVAPFKVAILNSWGGQRKWMSHHVHHAIWYKQCYSYYGILEALSGLPFEVEFISFEDIKADGISDDIGVIINAGEARTSWVGDDYWKDPEVVEKIRAFVQCGGGFIGVGEPTSYEHQGAFFQLPDVLGVQKEIGFSLSKDKYNDQRTPDHFILQDQHEAINYGESTRYVYQTSKSATVLDIEADDIKLATNTFGDGRAVYLAGLPYSPENARLLKRALYWAASKEDVFHEWHTTNIYTECAAYPESGTFVVINNAYEEQVTQVTKPNGMVIDVTLAPMGYQWFEI